MNFLERNKFIILIFYLIGICPFYINKNYILTFNRYTLVYSTISIIFLISILLYSAQIIINIITSFMLLGDVQLITINIFIYMCICLCFLFLAVNLINRKSQIKLFNRFNNSENDLQRIIYSFGVSNQFSNSIFPSIYVIFTYFFIYACAHIYCSYFFGYVFGVFATIFGIAIILSMLVSAYIQFLAKNILSDMTLVNEQFKLSLSSDLSTSNNYKKLIEIVNIMEEFFKIKRIFHNAFGLHLVVHTILDFCTITLNIFMCLSFVNMFGFNIIEVYIVCLYILPHLIKYTLLVVVIDRFGTKVTFSFIVIKKNK